MNPVLFPIPRKMRAGDAVADLDSRSWVTLPVDASPRLRARADRRRITVSRGAEIDGRMIKRSLQEFQDTIEALNAEENHPHVQGGDRETQRAEH